MNQKKSQGLTIYNIENSENIFEEKFNKYFVQEKINSVFYFKGSFM